MDFGNGINKFYPDHFPVPYIRLSQLRFKSKMMFPQFSLDCTIEWNTSTITRTKICIWYVLTFNMYECLHYYDNNQCLFDKYCNPTWLFCDMGNSVYHPFLSWQSHYFAIWALSSLSCFQEGKQPGGTNKYTVPHAMKLQGVL